MKLLKCPINGVRPLNEFMFGGECREMPDPDSSSDLVWASYVHYRDNAPGMKKEWWYHTPMTDEVLSTYLYGEAFANKKEKTA
jgi:sarcosine oxidase subunit delta